MKTFEVTVKNINNILSSKEPFVSKENIQKSSFCANVVFSVNKEHYKFEYNFYYSESLNRTNTFPIIARQVFPKEKTYIVYEDNP